MTLQQWIVEGETGTSSKTMWAAIVGAVSGGGKGFKFDVPNDPDDFRRCILFAEQCSLNGKHFKKIKKVFKWWSPFVDNWEELANLWEEESPSGRCPKLYARIQELEEQSMVLDGWVKTGNSSWKKDNSQKISLQRL